MHFINLSTAENRHDPEAKRRIRAEVWSENVGFSSARLTDLRSRLCETIERNRDKQGEFLLVLFIVSLVKPMPISHPRQCLQDLLKDRIQGSQTCPCR